MTEDMLKAVLDSARAKIDREGTATLPEARLLTLYAAHGGVSLTVAKIEEVRVTGGLVRARNAKGETFLLALEDVFAAAIEGGSEGGTARKAGFLG